MENHDPWEPTFPAGCTLLPETAYGGSVRDCLAHGPVYLARWPAVDTSAAPTSAATAATAASTAKAKLARWSSGGRIISGGASRGGENSGRRSGGVGGGGEGSEERQNAMTYNNAYVDEQWGIFRHAGAMRLITRKASLAGVKLPASPMPTCKA